jgi:hypothetical protein
VALATALLLFVSVLLHELGHALVALSQGVRVRSITLFLLGGVASVERECSTARGALLVAYLEPVEHDEPGGLQVTPPTLDSRPGTPQRLHFQACGVFERHDQAGNTQSQGSWELWSDGSLELTQAGTDAVVRERIWFTKPNLRLRSSVERHLDGTPARASFSSEIRRVSRPTP